MDNDILNRIDNMNVLGINIDSKFKFTCHVSSMCSMAGRQLNVLQRLEVSLDYTSRLSIYKSFIMSHSTIVPWCGCLRLKPHCQNSRLLKYGPLDLCSMTLHKIIMLY